MTEMDEESAVTAQLVPKGRTKNMLGTLSGCYVPTSLNIMGIILFLRLAWAVGQVGILAMLGILAIAESMAVLTVLSLSALVSNGEIRGGGSYFLISRSLGPAPGGSIGVLFYFGYAMGVAFYTIGVATTIQTTWFPRCDSSGDSAHYCYDHSIEWLTTGIGSMCLLLTLAISLAGAEFFAKFNVAFFAIQVVAIVTGVISFLHPHSFESVFTESGQKYNSSTSWPTHFVDNLFPDYTADSSCNGACSFAAVFAITFPMATGIMEGANLSGDLKTPAESIPRGTLWAVCTAILTYVILILSFGGAFERGVLQKDLTVFQASCLGPEYIIVVGIIISAMSSALGSLFGASRVLQAIARDELLPVLSVFGFGSKKGDEPRVAVLFTWVIAQAALFMGNIDVVAPVITAFFCLSYALTNLTCFSLSVMGVPNFRPRWRYFNHYTALLGFLINMVIVFYLNWVYALVGVLCLLLLGLYLAFRAPIKDWGDLSQELMFHQVRKYLLLIDETKQHSKFWKPNMLVIHEGMQPELAAFANTLKKGGLLVFGQVVQGQLDRQKVEADHIRSELSNFIKTRGLKVTVAPDIRVGYQVLITCGGLGGMTFNTVVAGLPGRPHISVDTDTAAEGAKGPLYMEDGDPTVPSSRLSPQDYCRILHDALFLEKNVIVACNYGHGRQHKGKLYVSGYQRQYIDVWLLPPWQTETGDGALSSFRLQPGYGTQPINSPDTALLETSGVMALLAQLGQTFKQGKVGPNRSPSDYRLRVTRVRHSMAESHQDIEEERQAMHSELWQMARRARLEVQRSDLRIILSSDVYQTHPCYQAFCTRTTTLGKDPLTKLRPLESLPLHEYAVIAGQIFLQHSCDAVQLFVPLPVPPSGDDLLAAESYLSALQIMTAGLPPTVLVCPGENIQFISTEI